MHIIFMYFWAWGKPNPNRQLFAGICNNSRAKLWSLPGCVKGNLKPLPWLQGGRKIWPEEDLTIFFMLIVVGYPFLFLVVKICIICCTSASLAPQWANSIFNHSPFSSLNEIGWTDKKRRMLMDAVRKKYWKLPWQIWKKGLADVIKATLS